MKEIIEKKKNGIELSDDEINEFIDGYVAGDIPDYQVSALLMAICFQGLSEREINSLTGAMLHSGDIYSLNEIDGVKVDKHSTGGIGDKTTFIVAPIMAAGGLKVAKMSGGGLGYTGGTLDKLASIPGFNYAVDYDFFIKEVSDIGISLCGQTMDLVPADKKLYALRDVTATVDSLPLIASSIMSKKLAMDTDVIVLDVKYGSGAFMATVHEAIKLAHTMIKIGVSFNRKVAAIISDMNAPLGYSIGNSLEVIEAYDVLNCSEKTNESLKEVSLVLAGMGFYMAGMCEKLIDGINKADSILNSGAGMNKFIQLMNYQSSGKQYTKDNFVDSLPKSSYVYKVCANNDGYVRGIDSRQIGVSALKLGAGREKIDDIIDHSVGIVLKCQVGDMVNAGEILAYVHSNKEDISLLLTDIESSFDIGSEKVHNSSHIVGIVDINGFTSWDSHNLR